MFKRRKNEDLATMEPGDSPAAVKPVLPTQAAKPPEISPAVKADNGLGVPPYRPALPKESVPMGRTPYPVPTPPTSAPASLTPPASSVMRPPQAPGAAPGMRPARDPAERRTLVVGKGISVQGTVQDAERLVVEGTVEASMINAAELSISPGGVFRGEVEVEDAEVAGTIDGTLTARGNLFVRGTGRVLGTARCRRLQVEDGGQITGRIEMLNDPQTTRVAETSES